jgi:hypothetical protein
MKLKSYNQFTENRLTNEEFIGKIWRDVTGKNKDRIKKCRSDIDSILIELKKKSDFFKTHGYLFKEYPFSEISIDTVRNLNFSDYAKRIINESVDKLTIEVKKNYPKGSCYSEIEKFFKEIFIELFEKKKYFITNNQIEFTKKYDSEEYSIFVTYINKIIYSLDSSDGLLTPNVPFKTSYAEDRDRNFIYLMVSKIEEEFLTDLIIHILKESNQIKSKFFNIYDLIKKQYQNLFYYLPILTKGDIKDGEYNHTLSNFLKSLVLRLKQKNHKYIITNNELCDYSDVGGITNDNKTSYTSEYGVNFLDKIKIDLTKTKVSDLESFKSLKESIKRLEKFTKLDENIKKFNQIIKDISSYISKVYMGRTFYDTSGLENKFPNLLKKIKENNIVYNTIGSDGIFNSLWGSKIDINSIKALKNDYTEIVGESEAKYYEDITLKKLNKPKDAWIYIDFQSIINNFKIFESNYGNSIIQDLLLKRGLQFKGINTIKIVEKDTTNIWREDEQLLGGNIIYHGSIHYNLDKPGEIRKLIYKKSPYEMGYAGYGMYLTNLLSSAAHYQYLRATQGTVKAEGLPDKIKQAFETPNSEYFPTIYRITLKPGVVFEYKPKGDTTCDWKELNHYRNIGSAGWHSGNMQVGGGETIEITIVDENSIIKVEKVKPSEILNLDDGIWNRGSKQLSKDEFLKWYKDLIQKRKENL